MPSAASAWRPASSSRSCASTPQRSSASCTASSHAGSWRRAVAAIASSDRASASRVNAAPAGRARRTRPPSRRETRRAPTVASSAAIEPASGVAVGGKDLSQSRYASALASRRAACEQRHHGRAGARRRQLPAGLVARCARPRCARAARACGARGRGPARSSATGRSPRPRWSSTCAAAAQASSSKPSQSACAGGSAASSRAIAANGWSSGTSVSTTSAGASPWASSARASRIGAAGLDRDPRRGTEREQAIGRRRLGRVRGPFDGDPGELLLETGRTADSAVERIARRLPPRARAAGAIDDARAPSSCAVATTRRAACSKPRGSRRIHSAPQRSRASSCVATSVSSAASKPLSPSAAVGGPSDAASVRVVSMRGIQVPRRAKARRAGASSSTNGTSTTASRHETDACPRPVGAGGGDGAPRASPGHGLAKPAPCESPGARGLSSS